MKKDIFADFNSSLKTSSLDDDKFVDSNSSSIGKMRFSRKNIEINKIKPHKDNTFSILEDDEFETLVLSVQEMGVTHPLIVMEDESGYTILSGHRRKKAAELNGFSVVPCLVVDNPEEVFTSKADVISFIGEENFSARKISPIEVARFAKKIEDSISLEGLSGRKRDLIAERIPVIKVSSRQLQTYMDLLVLPEILEHYIANGSLSLLSASSLARFIKSNLDNKNLICNKISLWINEHIITLSAFEDQKLSFDSMIEDITSLQIEPKKNKAKTKKEASEKQTANSFKPAYPFIKSIHSKISKFDVKDFCYPKSKKKQAELKAMVLQIQGFLDAMDGE